MRVNDGDRDEQALVGTNLANQKDHPQLSHTSPPPPPNWNGVGEERRIETAGQEQIDIHILYLFYDIFVMMVRTKSMIPVCHTLKGQIYISSSAGSVRILIFCSISIFLLASLLTARGPEFTAGAEQQGMYSLHHTFSQECQILTEESKTRGQTQSAF